MVKEYTVKAHPTKYAGVMFRSRLEARWACFFDLAGWRWQYEPIDLPGWSPDFRVEFPCGHSECPPSHTLLVEIKPYFSKGHQCLNFAYGEGIPAHASAAFGNDPSISEWEMSHGAGGGIFSIPELVAGWESLWSSAGNSVQWHPTSRKERQPEASQEEVHRVLAEIADKVSATPRRTDRTPQEAR